MDSHDRHDPQAGHVMTGPKQPAPAEAAGHEGHAGHGDHAAVFRDRFWVSLALAVPGPASASSA
jgi:Cu2+-exporting ATPase